MPQTPDLDIVHCRECGARQRVGPSVRQRPCTSPTAPHGFVIDRVEVLFLGRCPQCVALSPGASGPRPHPEQGET